SSPPFPYTTLFRSRACERLAEAAAEPRQVGARREGQVGDVAGEVEAPRAVRTELGARHPGGRELDAYALDEGARHAVLERHAADHGAREHDAGACVAIRRLEPASVEVDAPGRGARDARGEGLQPREGDAGGQTVGGRRAG